MNMLTQHNRKTARLSPDHTFAHMELGVWSGDETKKSSADEVDMKRCRYTSLLLNGEKNCRSLALEVTILLGHH